MDRRPGNDTRESERRSTQSRVTRLPRHPATLGALDLYARIGGGPGVLQDPARITAFVDRVRAGVEVSTANAARLHGWHRQNMFEALVVALGELRLLKSEDAGECFYKADGDIAVPDYRFLSSDGEQVLIEIKNHYRENATEAFHVTARYLGALERYSTIVGCRLLLGVYWASVNHWTLTDSARLARTDAEATLDYVTAYRYNEANIIGDRLIATTTPIQMRIPADPTKPRTIDGSGHANFTTGLPTFRVGTRDLTTPGDQDLAMRMLLWSPWEESEEVEVDDEGLVALTITAAPHHEVPGQGFEILGWISQYFAANYWLLTADQGEVRQLALDHDPQAMNALLPPLDRAVDFPLWQFRVLPHDTPPPAAAPSHVEQT
jgi:hypothetical protein